MKHLLYALLTAVSILFTSCGPSSNTNNPQVPNVPQPQPQPQPEVTQKVVIGYLPLDDWEFENLFPTIEVSDAYQGQLCKGKSRRHTQHRACPEEN